MFIAKKRSKFSLKFFAICEVVPRYVSEFFICTDKGIVHSPKFAIYSISSKTVLHLMDRFLGKSYCETMDNYYMSSQLAHIEILEKQTHTGH